MLFQSDTSPSISGIKQHLLCTFRWGAAAVLFWFSKQILVPFFLSRKMATKRTTSRNSKEEEKVAKLPSVWQRALTAKSQWPEKVWLIYQHLQHHCSIQFLRTVQEPQCSNFIKSRKKWLAYQVFQHIFLSDLIYNIKRPVWSQGKFIPS